MLTPILIVLVVLQLVCLVVLLLRKQAAPEAIDPRQAQLPDQLLRLDARTESLDRQLRDDLKGMRAEIAAEAQRSRTAATTDFGALRTEITGSVATLGATLHGGLAEFRKDNAASAETLRTAVNAELTGIGQRLQSFIGAVNQRQLEDREALHAKLNELTAANAQHQEKLRTSVGESLAKLNTDNAAKLEEMRATVDEKLHATLHTRLTESFGQVTDQLNKVHTGLGEMSKLSEGVDGLSRIFTNVKSRGGVAEVLLGQLIGQTLAPNQFVHNAQVKPGTDQVVEYAVKFPGASGETLLPIDAKFPREDWERLESAYEAGIPEAIAAAGRAFETAIRTEGKRICGKYINEPVTTPYAIMFLPTESLYAEVIRRDGLQDDLQRNCHVTIAGPHTLSAILISFKMGFHMLNLQKKGDDVWKVLAATRTEFEKFGDLMGSMEKQVGTVQNTIQKLGTRARAINRTLRDVSETDSTTAGPYLIEELPGVMPLLAATDAE